MRKIFVATLTFWLLLIAGACKNQQKSEKPVQPAADSLNLDVQMDNAPDWALKPPQQDGVLYAVGQASSLRAELARRKAMLNARVKLAKMLAQQSDSLQELLRFSRVTKEKQIQEGKRWHSFVLMELPLQKETQP